MKKEQFEILMYALYGNNQLFIPQGQTIQEWIDNAFDNAMKQGQSEQLFKLRDNCVNGVDDEVCRNSGICKYCS